MSIKSRILKRKAEIFAEIEGDVRSAALSLQGKILSKAPVDTGELRKPTTWPIEKINNLHYTISTDSPYAHVLEYGLYPNPPKGGKGKTENGYSKQAPQGFVRISIEEVKNEFKRGS